MVLEEEEEEQEAEDDDDVPVTTDDADEEDQADDLAQAYLWWCESSLLSSLSWMKFRLPRSYLLLLATLRFSKTSHHQK